MQGPYASDPGEETMSLPGLVRRPEIFEHRSQHTGVVTQHSPVEGKKGKHNVIKLKK